jgi:hypothetical protein
VITVDPDDNKFVDCAIAAEADFILTSDHHFDVLPSSGYKPKPIDPLEFTRQHLSAYHNLSRQQLPNATNSTSIEITGANQLILR